MIDSKLYQSLVNLLDTRTEEGVTALLTAITSGHAEITKILLDYGANPVMSTEVGIKRADEYAKVLGKFLRIFHPVMKMIGSTAIVEVINRLNNKPINEWDVEDVCYFVSTTCHKKSLPKYLGAYFR